MSDKALSMEVDEAEKSSSSDSSDSEEESAKEQELLNKSKELESQLSQNKYLYDVHLELVDIYKKLGDLTSLREAYERFRHYFPLTPKIWLDWLKDEIKLATTSEDQKRVSELFEKATEDYLSVDLWTEYAQFSIGVNDLNTTRSILDKGLSSAGLVCDKGSLLWDTLRELEHAHIALYPANSDAWKAQVQKVADVFKRQLSVPLLDIENVYREWQEWSKSLPDGVVDSTLVEYGYKKALKLLETYKPFEEALLACQTPEEYLKTYKDYIKAVTDPSTVICLYERAANELCLVPDFWVDYCTYVFKLGEAAFNVSKKALRNCPWSEELWVWRLRILENLKKGEDEVLESFEQGLSSISPLPGLELWLAYLEYTHRCVGSPEKLDKLFQKAIEQLGYQNDPSFQVYKWYARMLAHRGDMKDARKIWGQIMSSPENKGSAVVWLEYSHLERQYGEPHTLRILFQKALAAIKDWPQCIMDEWILYERHFGTLEDVLKCVQKCREVTETLTKKFKEEGPANQLPKNSAHEFKEPYAKSRKRRHDEEQKPVEKKRFKEERREREDRREVAKRFTEKPQSNLKEKTPETTVFVSNIHSSVDEKKLKSMFPNAAAIEIVKDKYGKSRCFGYIQFNQPEETMVALARDREPLDGRPVFISELKPERQERKPAFKYSQTVEGNKLFVKGLPFSKSKEDVHKLFEPYGAKDVRLVYKKSGQPKGIAYVEFENEEKAKKAMEQTDKMKVDDFEISVAISAPPPKSTGKFDFVKEREPTRHARTMLMVPRALQVKSAPSTSKSKPAAKEINESNNSGNSLPQAKSNADFRNMFLKK